MIFKLVCPRLLGSGAVDDGLFAVLDGMVNYYVIKAPYGLVCFDTGWRRSSLRRGFNSLGLDPEKVKAVFLTHLHWDHASCAGMFPGAKLFVGESEHFHLFTKRKLSNLSLTKVSEGKFVEVAGVTVKCIGTPGHTCGSMSYLVEGKWVFTGDTICLKHGQALPFPSIFNRDGRALEGSIRSLAELKEVKCLMTAHSGLCRDVESAFDRWRSSQS